MSSDSSLSSRNCPICRSAGVCIKFPPGFLWSETVFRQYRCLGCRTVFTDPVPTEDQLAEVYDWTSYHTGYAEAPEARDNATLTSLSNYSTGKKLLDVGCGTGSFLRRAATAGYEPMGAEITERVAQEASTRAGVPVFPLVTLLDGTGQFDVIHCRDVLAHFVKPRETLGLLVNLLAVGGLLVLDDPIEENPSLVLAAARAWSKCARHPAIRSSSRGPTMLMRMTAGSHEMLLEGLGLELVGSRISETGWPYYLPGRQIRTFGTAVKAGVAFSARTLAWLDVSNTFGNRIFTIYRKKG
jgi:SAM-dependent methyltransferase